MMTSSGILLGVQSGKFVLAEGRGKLRNLVWPPSLLA